MKTCSKCRVPKDEVEFRRRGRGDGPRLRSHCKECINKKEGEYRLRTKEAMRAYQKEYYTLNSEKINSRNQKWQNEAYAKNPNFHLQRVLRSRFRKALQRRGVEKESSSLELLGCPVWHLWAHLEFLFKPGMTRANHGPVWDIDHIRPIASFDLTKPEEQKACFHWTNLQPLFKKDNREKGASYNG